MCNAYTIRPTIGAKEIYEVVSAEVAKLPTNLIRRGGPGVVVTGSGGELVAERMRWGFDHPKYKLVNNARSESLSRPRGMWKESLEERRCLVPMSVFYEWQELDSKNKQAFEFRMPNDEWMWIPGLYEETSTGRHYATITTEPTERIRPIHDRLLAVMDFERALDFLHGGPPPSAPYDGPLAITPCASPLKRAKKPPEDPQGSLF